jgi:hypothetical protein
LPQVLAIGPVLDPLVLPPVSPVFLSLVARLSLMGGGPLALMLILILSLGGRGGDKGAHDR